MKRRIQSFLARAVSPHFADAFITLGAELSTARVHRRSRRRMRSLRNPRSLHLNLGCGAHRLDGFLHLDMAPGVDYRVDLRRPIPLPDGCAERIFSEHFLEHLAYPGEADGFLRECCRLLEPGGELLVSVPDTEWPLREYATGGTEYLAACADSGQIRHPECETFLEHINYHFRQRSSRRRETHFECHRYAYDRETLSHALARCGFADIEERDFDPALDQASRGVGSLRLRARKQGSAAPIETAPA